MREPYLVRPASSIKQTMGKPDYHGTCVHCGSGATKEMLFKITAAVLLERYCDACSKQIEQGKEFYKVKTWPV